MLLYIIDTEYDFLLYISYDAMSRNCVAGYW
jgi:hypothetical protein